MENLELFVINSSIKHHDKSQRPCMNVLETNRIKTLSLKKPTALDQDQLWFFAPQKNTHTHTLSKVPTGKKLRNAYISHHWPISLAAALRHGCFLVAHDGGPSVGVQRRDAGPELELLSNKSQQDIILETSQISNNRSVGEQTRRKKLKETR